MIKELENLKQLVADDKIGKSQEFGGAGVIISEEPRDTGDTVVVTEFSHELSWLFEKLRDIFYSENRLDYLSKIDFFSRLADAALKADKSSARTLCLAVIEEAQNICSEF